MVHFAGRKAVGESVSQPMLYYTHNVAAAVNLIEAMRKHSLKNVSGAVWCLMTSLPAMLSGGTVAVEDTAEAFTPQPGAGRCMAAAELADVAPRRS